MNRILITLMVTFLIFPVLADGPTRTKKTDAARTLHGKAEAPVIVTAQLEASSAQVQLQFQADASDVDVKIWGVDGLEVTNIQPTPESTTQRARGDTLAFDVAFTPGPGRSYLVVGVYGKFGGGRRSAVRSFPIGTPTAEQQKSSGKVVTDSQGRRIKVMPIKPQ